MSVTDRFVAADAARTGASRIPDTTTFRTFGESTLNDDADSGSRKQTNSSRAANAAIAGTISRVNRPYPRAFAQHVASIPIRILLARRVERVEGAEEFAERPSRSETQNQRRS